MVLPDLVPICREQHFQATVYSGDRCRCGDAQSLALTMIFLSQNVRSLIPIWMDAVLTCKFKNNGSARHRELALAVR
jgi:hypothetical protein